jgi:hypothetical protein
VNQYQKKQNLLAEQALIEQKNAEKAEEQRAQELKEQEQRAECEKSLKCMGDLKQSVAEAKCKPLIEKRAKNNFEWGDGEIFTGFGGHKLYSNTVVYYGDNVKFQNGFGGWSYYTYYCEFNLSDEKIYTVDAVKGRL